MVVGGMEHVVQVVLICWIKGNIYDELPKASERFVRPPSPTSSPEPPQVQEVEETSDGDKFISVSRNFPFEICNNLSINQIPEELRRILRRESTCLRDMRPLDDLIEQVSVMATSPNKETIPHQQQQGLVIAGPNAAPLVEGGEQLDLLQQAKKGEDGLYEEHIEFSEAGRLADLIGVHQRDVIQAVLEDNNERKVTETQSDPEEENQDTTEDGGEGDQKVNLNPDSDEELESDSD